MAVPFEPEVKEVHQACMHAFDPSIKYPEVKKVSTDVQLQNETYLRVILHPRWCMECILARQKTIRDLGVDRMTEWKGPALTMTDPVVIHARGKVTGGVGKKEKVKTARPFERHEETAYNLGLMKGRELGVELNFEMGQESARIALLCGPTASEVQTLLQSLLAEEKMNDMIRDFDACCKMQKNPDFTWYIGQLENSMKEVKLDAGRQELVRKMVQRYRDGQLRGLYWTWLTEARGLEEANLMERNRIFEEAISAGVQKDHRDWVWS